MTCTLELLKEVPTLAVCSSALSGDDLLLGDCEVFADTREPAFVVCPRVITAERAPPRSLEEG